MVFNDVVMEIENFSYFMHDMELKKVAQYGTSHIINSQYHRHEYA